MMSMMITDANNDDKADFPNQWRRPIMIISIWLQAVIFFFKWFFCYCFFCFFVGKSAPCSWPWAEQTCWFIPPEKSKILKTSGLLLVIFVIHVVFWSLSSYRCSFSLSSIFWTPWKSWGLERQRLGWLWFKEANIFIVAVVFWSLYFYSCLLSLFSTFLDHESNKAED